MSGGYLFTDRRAVSRVDGLDIKDQILANWLVSQPVAAVDPEVEVYEPAPDVKDVEYNLKPLKMHFGEFLRHHATKKDSSSWLETFKSLLPGVVGDSSLLVMGDEPVATFRRDARLSLSRLKKEQPHIVAKYTKIVSEAKFDEEAFRSEMPEVHAAYRGRSFRLKTAGPGAGLHLQ